jgi:MSHA pilin protein MshC
MARAVQFRTAGFTMVELVVTLVLIAIIAVVAIPRGPEPAPGLAAQAEQLASDIRYIQSRAMARSERHRVCLAAGGYTFATTSCASPIVHPATGSAAAVGFSGVTFTWSANLNNAYLAFDSGGVPYTTDPGTALIANATITITSNQGGTRGITISPETGRVLAP